MGDLPEDVARRLKKLSRGVMPAGGHGGRVLRKASDADFDVAWQPDSGVPSGGTTGQVLTKTGYSDGNYDWRTPPTIPAGGTTGQVLTKIDATDFNADWETPASGSSGFPIGPEDDTNATHEISTALVGTASVFVANSILDAHPGTTGDLQIVTGTSGGSDSSGVSIDSTVYTGADAKLTLATQESAAQGAEATLIVTNDSATSGSIELAIQNGAHTASCTIDPPAIFLPNLPTSDPGNTGQLWNDSGTVKVSP